MSAVGAARRTGLRPPICDFMIKASKGLLLNQEHSILYSFLCVRSIYCALARLKYPFDAQIISLSTAQHGI